MIADAGITLIRYEGPGKARLSHISAPLYYSDKQPA